MKTTNSRKTRIRKNALANRPQSTKRRTRLQFEFIQSPKKLRDAHRSTGERQRCASVAQRMLDRSEWRRVARLQQDMSCKVEGGNEYTHN